MLIPNSLAREIYTKTYRKVESHMRLLLRNNALQRNDNPVKFDLSNGFTVELFLDQFSRTAISRLWYDDIELYFQHYDKEAWEQFNLDADMTTSRPKDEALIILKLML